MVRIYLVAVPGFEPGSSPSKGGMLPLHHTAIKVRPSGFEPEPAD